MIENRDEIERRGRRMRATRLMMNAASRLGKDERGETPLEPWQRRLCRLTIFHRLEELSRMGLRGEALLSLRAMRPDSTDRKAA